MSQYSNLQLHPSPVHSTSRSIPPLGRPIPFPIQLSADKFTPAPSETSTHLANPPPAPAHREPSRSNGSLHQFLLQSSAPDRSKGVVVIFYWRTSPSSQLQTAIHAGVMPTPPCVWRSCTASVWRLLPGTSVAPSLQLVLGLLVNFGWACQLLIFAPLLLGAHQTDAHPSGGLQQSPWNPITNSVPMHTPCKP
jgi:hypothetical protein